MEIVCQQKELNNAIQLVNKAVASRPTHPILSNILFTADQVTKKISLTGFDLNLGIQTSFDAKVLKSGAITIPAKILSEIVSKFPNESPVTLKVEEGSENILLTSDRGSFNLKGILSDDYPQLPFVESGTSLDINPSIFLQALKLTIFSSSNDESKQLLTGVNFKFRDQCLESAATDGHRLAVVLTSENKNFVETKNTDNLTSDEDYLSVTIPTRSLREIEKLVSSNNQENSIKLFYDKGQVVFISSDQIITTRTLEGNYPNYSQLIPDSFSKIFRFEKISFINSLERIAVLADQQSSVVKININKDNFASISADAQDIGNAKEILPVSFSGDEIEIAFNVRYLLEGLRVISSQDILLKCNLATTPAVLVPDDNSSFTYLVMPVQVRS
tara:strand:- start:1039 stop:2202 length:1164 start_codon:yes stop_codon:yes gene_type:complete